MHIYCFSFKLRNLTFTMLKVNIRYSIPFFKIQARFQTKGKVILRTLQQQSIRNEDFLAFNKAWLPMTEQSPFLWTQDAGNNLQEYSKRERRNTTGHN